MKLTTMEREVIKWTLDNEYQANENLKDSVNKPTWLSVVSDYSFIKGKQLSGVISSLTQKGLITTQDWDIKGSPKDATISVNEKGFDLFIKGGTENEIS